jgi:hypothetical protein
MPINCMLFMLYVLLQLLQQSTRALREIYSWAIMKPLHVSALRFLYQGVIQEKIVQFQHPNVDIMSPWRKWLKF